MQTSLKLYYSTQTCATRARWAMEELGVPYELVRLDLSKKEQKQLDEQQYLLGQSFSMVDVLVGSAVIWGTAMGAISGFANLDGYCERLKQRPAFLKAYAH